MSAKQHSWPFAEAQRVQTSIERSKVAPPIIFETGFGPSGLPHIGTFAEVARTAFVMNAFSEISELDTVLYAFCDDMDGLRRVPKNLPNQQMLAENVGKPLWAIPDPFGCCESFSGHMENQLVRFLESYGFQFQLKSSVKEYNSGRFNEGLHLILDRVDAIKNIIRPTLQEENREAWSPFFPICENCGRLYTPIVTAENPERDTIEYRCEGSFGDQGQVKGCGHTGEVSVMDGKVKVGWKVDWALRWFCYDIAYEMYGKDLIDSAKLSSKIDRVLGGVPPQGLVYEMFLNHDGKKISKSVGEGITVDQWLSYAPLESMLQYLFLNPKKQRRLYFDVIPKSVDDYLDLLRSYPELDQKSKHESVLWHIEQMGRQIPPYSSGVNFSLVMNLISAIGAGDKSLLMDYISRYDQAASENREVIEPLVDSAMNYFRDFIEPNKKYHTPDDSQKQWFSEIYEKLSAMDSEDENDIQSVVFDAARKFELNPKQLFEVIYQTLLGQERGPRFSTFVKLLGKNKVLDMIKIHID